MFRISSMELVLFFLMIRVGLWDFERKITEVSDFSSHFISRIHTVKILLTWCYHWLLDWDSFDRLFCYKTAFFHTILFGRKSLCTTHTLGWGMSSRREYLHKIFEILQMCLFSFSYLLIQSSISLWIPWYLFYTMGY